jgi:hypothetical protein
VSMLVYRSPDKYCNTDNFFYYFQSAVRRRAAAVLKDYGKSAKDVEIGHVTGSLAYSSPKNVQRGWPARRFPYEQPDSPIDPEDFSDKTPSADEVIERRDDLMTLIKTVQRILRDHPLFNRRCDYLAWPIIYSLFHDKYDIFSRLDFRERCAIRIIQIQVEDLFERKA